MCLDPVTATGLALSLGGTVLGGMEQSKNTKRMVQARNDAAEAEMIRQRAFQDEAGSTFADTLGTFQPQRQAEALEQSQQKRTQQIQDRPLSDAGSVPLAGSAPSVVRENLASTFGEANTRARNDATRLGRLSGYDDFLFGNNINLSRSGGRLGEISSFARGSAGLLPVEQQAAANNAYRAPSGFADLLQLAGTGVGLAGMTGWNPFGGGGSNLGRIGYSSGQLGGFGRMVGGV